MPRVRKFRPVSIGGRPRASAARIGRERWRRLEKAIRQPIDPEVRGKIAVANHDFLTLATWEETATPASSVIDDVLAIKAAGWAFRNALLLKDGFQARHELETQLGLPRGALRNVALGPLRALARGCDAVVVRLKTQEGYLPGEAWARWILRLTDILKKARLPTKVSKDGTSPFVVFIAELQRCLPAKFQRVRTDATLAAAIVKARRA
jgi:hypothetical protein